MHSPGGRMWSLGMWVQASLWEGSDAHSQLAKALTPSEPEKEALHGAPWEGRVVGGSGKGRGSGQPILQESMLLLHKQNNLVRTDPSSLPPLPSQIPLRPPLVHLHIICFPSGSWPHKALHGSDNDKS